MGLAILVSVDEEGMLRESLLVSVSACAWKGAAATRQCFQLSRPRLCTTEIVSTNWEN